ncbi:MAG: hypothetical protein RBT75_15880 [Anaerolineae bacterium]|nr:hypothetical protein [Anaerolineae bacterium]
METIARILAIEQEAAEIYDDAQHQAAHRVAEAEKTASVLLEATVTQSEREAENQVNAARAAAEAEYARVLAQAEAEAQAFELRASSNVETAVAFVLEQISRQ